MDHADESKGHVELICGSMFSGKTEELIRRVKRAQIARQRVQVFAHAIDTRYGTAKVASHSGFDLDAHPVRTAADILAQVQPNVEVVAVDEAQFVDWEIAEVVSALANRGIR